jgi:RimJ/RimL family protein N-acetyltransferase
MFILEASGRAAAQVSLYDAAGGSAEFGRLLVDPAQRGRGLSHRAIALCLHIADDVLRLAEVHLEVKGDNLRAIRAYEAAGFIHDEARSGVGGSLVMTRNHP